MTVSRVLRQPGQVAPATAEKVELAIRELAYRPDPAMSALAAYRVKGGGTQRGSVLALLDCDGSTYSRILLEGACAEAGLHGYMVQRFRLAPAAAEQSRLSRMLFHRGVQGLLFGPSDEPWKFEGWNWDEFAAVSMGALPHSPAMHAVSMDYFHGAFSACQMLASQGCRRIGLAIERTLESRTGHRWLGGYSAWALQTGAPVIQYNQSPERPRRFQAWLRKEKPDGILTVHPRLESVLSLRGIRMVSLNSSGAGRASPCYFLNPEAIGSESVRLLHHALLRRELGLPAEPKQVALRGIWKSKP